jgi:hypothetical protein
MTGIITDPKSNVFLYNPFQEVVNGKKACLHSPVIFQQDESVTAEIQESKLNAMPGRGDIHYFRTL